MSEFKLAAGSHVKYGCISTDLYPILRQGLAANMPRQSFDQATESAKEAAPARGIMVGELMAYFAACAAFCKATSTLHQNNEQVMGSFVNALQNQHGEKPQMPELENIAVTAGLPVILEIELAEDCVIEADSQFTDVSEAEKSWKLWRSGALLREGGIPASWIKKFYFPRLLDYRDATSSKNPRTLEQTTDCALMVGGLMQVWHKDTPADLLHAFRKQYGRINFSQHSNFDDTALERFFNLNSMLDPATRLLNQMTIWQDIDALAKKQQIPLM
ncbi:hypothetical protein H8L32_06185 [Undibacterium sp. CY18W]|uniref:Uncharacterized protein n=1 Tax=Undibacterium hunanense TaxID=2762292 RepID=A0ABR6ZMD3_9BURK|nr:hypothetical protein [Undibacterium hunanense]MBC3917060.1 hypothetical protein [Undibacterium hunanense]